MRYVKWQKKKLLFWFSCSAALHQVCRGIANPILFRHPDLNSTEVTSATQQSFVGFPFDLGHVEAPGPHTQLKTWGRSTTTQCQAHSLFPFLWKEMTGIWLSPLLIPEVGEINPRVKAWHLPQLCFLTWCLWVLAASSEKTRRNSLLFFFFLLLFLFHTFIFVLSIKTPWSWNTLQKHPLMPRKRSTFYLSQQLAYLVDCQGDRAHGLQLLEAALHHPALPPMGLPRAVLNPSEVRPQLPGVPQPLVKQIPSCWLLADWVFNKLHRPITGALSYFFLRKHSDMIFSPSVGNVNIYEMGANCLNFL